MATNNNTNAEKNILNADPMEVAVAHTNVEPLTYPKTEIRKLYEHNIKINLIRNQAITRGIQICPALDKFYALDSYPELQKKLDEFEQNAESFFIYTRDEINNYYGNDKETLIEDINRYTDKLVIIEQVHQLGPLPVQIIYGLMLQKLYKIVKEGEFVETIKKLRPRISKSTAYNYMDAAEIVNYPGNERAYTSGLVTLYKLAGLYAKGTIPTKNYDGIISKFKELIEDINPDEFEGKEKEDIYDLITNYVVSIEIDFQQFPPKKEVMQSLFKIRYKIRPADIRRIRINSLDLKAKGLIKPVVNANFVNEYFSAVIKHDGDSKEAYDDIMGVINNNKKQIEDKTKIAKMSVAIATLKQTVDFFIDNNKNLSKHDYIDLKNVMEKLNTLVQKFENQHKLMENK